jgi:hypothetical protein
MNQLGHFEENLLTELRQVVAAQAAAETPRPVRPRGRLVLATAGAGAFAAALVFGVPAMNGDHAPAAHAVTDNDDGSVTITVNRLEDPEGLERELAAHGITADVTFAPPGKACRLTPMRFDLAYNPEPSVRLMVENGEEVLTLDPAETAGKTLVLEGREEVGYPGERTFVIAHWVLSGPIAPCELVDLNAG